MSDSISVSHVEASTACSSSVLVDWGKRVFEEDPTFSYRFRNDTDTSSLKLKARSNEMNGAPSKGSTNPSLTTNATHHHEHEVREIREKPNKRIFFFGEEELKPTGFETRLVPIGVRCRPCKLRIGRYDSGFSIQHSGTLEREDHYHIHCFLRWLGIVDIVNSYRKGDPLLGMKDTLYATVTQLLDGMPTREITEIENSATTVLTNRSEDHQVSRMSPKCKAKLRDRLRKERKSQQKVHHKQLILSMLKDSSSTSSPPSSSPTGHASSRSSMNSTSSPSATPWSSPMTSATRQTFPTLPPSSSTQVSDFTLFSWSVSVKKEREDVVAMETGDVELFPESETEAEILRSTNTFLSEMNKQLEHYEKINLNSNGSFKEKAVSPTKRVPLTLFSLNTQHLDGGCGVNDKECCWEDEAVFLDRYWC